MKAMRNGMSVEFLEGLTAKEKQSSKTIKARI